MARHRGLCPRTQPTAISRGASSRTMATYLSPPSRDPVSVSTTSGTSKVLASASQTHDLCHGPSHPTSPMPGRGYRHRGKHTGMCRPSQQVPFQTAYRSPPSPQTLSITRASYPCSNHAKTASIHQLRSPRWCLPRPPLPQPGTQGQRAIILGVLHVGQN